MEKENQVTTQIRPHMTDSCEMSKVSKSPQEETSQLSHCGSDVKSQRGYFLVKWSFPQPQNVIPVWFGNVVSSSEKLYGGKQSDFTLQACCEKLQKFYERSQKKVFPKFMNSFQLSKLKWLNWIKNICQNTFPECLHFLLRFGGKCCNFIFLFNYIR